ncbi:MAG: TIGR02266 family protein [candidate division NC10 bacterium]|nr:TIGR02266 family protein [candidate division NC10 bacterium]MBI4842161.1 TIGR02266 family protein [candidate division NC10 bacterium]
MTDRRAEPRAEVDLEVHYRTAQEFLSAYARNISGGGMYIRTQQSLPLNQAVRVRFTLPGVAHTFEIRGIVVWSNPAPSRSSFPSGMAVKFTEIDPKSQKIISDFVNKVTGTSSPTTQKRPEA